MARFRRPKLRPSRTNHKNTRPFSTIELLENRRLMCWVHEGDGLPAPLQEPVFIPDTGAPRFAGPEAAADIVWTNRGNSSFDTDGFGSTFGANADLARGVVDAVIVAYERMIGLFNYSDGSNTYSLSVSMSGTGLGASASLNSTFGPAGSQKPRSGSIFMGRGSNNQGSGWFLDPTPDDHSEFLGNIVNAYSGDAQAGSPAAGLSDFYTVVAAEMTHCVGLYGGSSSVPSWNARNTNTGQSDSAEGGGTGQFWVFRGPSIKHLMTSNNGGPGGNVFGGAIHGGGPGVNVSFQGDVYTGSQDQGNAIYEGGRRYMVNNAFALMFKDAYNYSTVDPAQFGTMYVARNSTTGAVVVRGSSGNDTISITQTGSTLTFSVDPVSDVGGTGALPAGGNLPAFVTSFDASEVTSISISADGGADSISFGTLSTTVPITLDAGGGDDSIAIGAGNILTGIPANITIDGNGGNDVIVYDDQLSLDSAPYTLNNATLTKTGLVTPTITNVEGAGLLANAQGTSITLASAAVATTVNAGGGDDTTRIGDGLLAQISAPVTVNGGAGNDTVILDDSAAAGGEFYIVNGLTLSRAFFAGYTPSNVESMQLITQPAADFVSVTNTAANVPLSIDSRGGGDVIEINATAAGAPVTLVPNDGNDSVTVNADNIATAEVVLGGPVNSLGTLTIRNGGLATLAAGAANVLRVGALTINPTGALDIKDGSFIYDYASGSQLSFIQSLINTGYATGAWNGNGIRSTAAANDPLDRTALGFAVATDLFSTFPALFAGQQIDATSVLVRHTLYGDADLNRAVDSDDFNRLAGSFGMPSINWALGNFNFDASVTSDDFNLLSTNFGQSLSGPEGVLGVAANPRVPEVAAVAPRAGVRRRG